MNRKTRKQLMATVKGILKNWTVMWDLKDITNVLGERTKLELNETLEKVTSLGGGTNKALVLTLCWICWDIMKIKVWYLDTAQCQIMSERINS